MYEDITYEVILQRMINRVLQQNPNIDTREGSIIFNALAPAAVEITNMYVQLDAILNETFADTASRDYLIQRAAERGLVPYPATFAILKGEFNIDIPIGSRFSHELLNYIAIEKISTGVFKMQCEAIGTVGNDDLGTLIPIEYIDGLTSAQLTELLIPAENEEDTEHFRQRYYNSLNAEAFGGNIKDYQEKVDALGGVGGVKVYPIWNGGGTVKLVIIASDYSVPTQTLIDYVQNAIDPTPQGTGVGIAPIGHVVTVQGVSSVSVDIAANITYEPDWDWAAVQPYAEQAVDDYFKELGEGWDSDDYIVVRISQIETRFLNLPGIVDIADTTLNGLAQNLTLTADEIAVRGNISG